MADWHERFSLDGKTALVTGASRGIGFDIATTFAAAGADIIATARDKSALEQLQQQVEALGRQCQVLTADLEDGDACRQVAADALAHAGTVDILVNNAGVALIDPLLDTPLAHWDTTMAINLRAPFLLAQALAPAMIAQSRGKILNVSSQAGVMALADHAAYSASKAGLNMLTQTMAAEWSRHNIQINAICPTVVMTDMGKEVWSSPEKNEPMLAKIPLGRFGEPQEIADLALFLASPASDLITGQSICADGGFTIM